MVTREQFSDATQCVKSNILQFLVKMAGYKNSIQRKVLDIATMQELQDVHDCIINQGLINKLTRLAKGEWQDDDDKDIESLYCAAMAVATIIKEYDWDAYYLSEDGLFQIAQRIEQF